MWILLMLLIAAILVALMTLYFWITAPVYDENEQPVTSILQAVDFPERNTMLAKDQPEYRTLPALYLRHPYGEFITCWQLTPWQRWRLLLTGKLWARQLTGGRSFQPITFSTDSRDLFLPNPVAD